MDAVKKEWLPNDYCCTVQQFMRHANLMFRSQKCQDEGHQICRDVPDIRFRLGHFLLSGSGSGQNIACRQTVQPDNLWSPYVIGRPYIFSSCSFFPSFFYLLLFFSSPNLSGRRLDVYHTLAHGVALVRI